MKKGLPVWIAGFLAVSPALADAPVRTTAPPAAASASDAPLNPRWEVRSVTLSGLTVWTFRPGHFVRNAPPAGPSLSPSPR